MAADPMVALESAIMVRLGADQGPVSADPQLASALPGGLHSRTATVEVYPFANMVLVRGDDSHTYGGRTWRHAFRYQIMVTDQSASIDAAAAALQRIYELLHNAHLEAGAMPMGDYELFYAARTGRVNVSPTSGGVEYQRVVDEYRLEVQPI